jgi:hypothetical protein
MDQNGYDSVNQMRGTLRYDKVPNVTAYERANYISSLKSFDEKVL